VVSPRPQDLTAWNDFREALAELGRTDPERARLYLASAACSLRDWTRAIRDRGHPRAARVDHVRNPERRR